MTAVYPSNRPISTVDSVYNWMPGTSPTKIMPSAGKQTSGWSVAEKPPAQYFNGMFGATSEWLTFLDTFIVEGEYDGDQRIAIGYDSMSGASVTPGDRSRSIAIGIRSGKGSSKVVDGVFIGTGAGESSDSSDGTVAIGLEAGKDSNSDRAVFLGRYAGYAATGNGKLCIGDYSGYNASGVSNIHFGDYAGRYSSGSNNLHIGGFSGNSSDGAVITSIGFYSGYGATGYNVIAIGNEAGRDLTADGVICVGEMTGKDSQSPASVFIGRMTGRENIGEKNVFVGDDIYTDSSTYTVPELSYVTAVGHGSYGEGSDGRYTTAIGYSTASRMTGVNDLSVFVGSSAGERGDNLSEVVCVGYRAGRFVTNSVGSVHLGAYAGYSADDAAYAVSIGYYAGYGANSGEAISIGYQAGYNTAGASPSATQSVHIGYNAGYQSVSKDSVLLGGDAGYGSTADSLTAIGKTAGYNSVSEFGVFAGYRAGADTAGTRKVAVGYQAGDSSPADYTVSLGSSSGKNYTGNYMIAIGEDAGSISDGTAIDPSKYGDNVIAIGQNAAYHTSNPIRKINDGSVFIGHRAGQDHILYGTVYDKSSIMIGPCKDGAKVQEAPFWGMVDADVDYIGVTGTATPFIPGHLTASERASWGAQWTSYGGNDGAMVWDQNEKIMYIYYNDTWEIMWQHTP